MGKGLLLSTNVHHLVAVKEGMLDVTVTLLPVVLTVPTGKFCNQPVPIVQY
jgi:hypothetical protein